MSWDLQTFWEDRAGARNLKTGDKGTVKLYFLCRDKKRGFYPAAGRQRKDQASGVFVEIALAPVGTMARGSKARVRSQTSQWKVWMT